VTRKVCKELLLVLTEDLMKPVVLVVEHFDALDNGVVNVLKPCGGTALVFVAM
jgi:hypothetical protein